MIPLASLIRGPVAAVVARYGRPVTLARRTGAFDPATQATQPGTVACTVPALVLSRQGQGHGTEVEVHVVRAALAAAGFPGSPAPGDILTLDGADWPVTAVETLSAEAEAAFHVVKATR